MNDCRSLLQVIPRAPNDCGGVGDYARMLAHRLLESHRIKSVFLSAAPFDAGQIVDGFEVLSPLRLVAKDLSPPEAILLHYVNYGYHSRGVPTWLPALIRQVKRAGDARLVTIFHEVYAAGTWRQSAFWLRPLQKRIARSLANLSLTSLVSNETQRAQLEELAPGAQIAVQPVMSNFGEPTLTLADLRDRDPHRWLICGGNELLERSLRSFTTNLSRIPAAQAPRELLVVGGNESPQIRTLLERLSKIQGSYHPRVENDVAAKLLSSCAFAWVDYFHQPGVALTTILKSTVFAAVCAHGVIPIFPHGGAPISLGGDSLPGPFFVTASEQNLPVEEERPVIGYSLHEWYRRHSSSGHLADMVAALFNR